MRLQPDSGGFDDQTIERRPVYGALVGALDMALNGMDQLQAYRNEVRATGGSTTAADALIQAIAHSQDLAFLPPLFEQLATESDRLGWFRDCDYAAVALQAVYAQAAFPQLRKVMLGFALERARWCASCATAGGEGLARSLHVRELEALARVDVQPFAPADGFAAR